MGAFFSSVAVVRFITVILLGLTFSTTTDATVFSRCLVEFVRFGVNNSRVLSSHSIQPARKWAREEALCTRRNSQHPYLKSFIKHKYIFREIRTALD